MANNTCEMSDAELNEHAKNINDVIFEKILDLRPKEHIEGFLEVLILI